jgi:DNA polymerase
VSGHDALRRYLEQRRELGEREFTLDDLSVEDALRLLGGAKGGAAPDRARRYDREVLRAALEAAPATGGPPAEPEPPVPPAPMVVPSPTPLTPPVVPADAPVVGGSGEGGPAWLGALGVPMGLRVGDPRTGRTTGSVAALASLAEVAQAAAACHGCSLAATATNVVPGEGNPDADFVCVGEAPGANEDASGRPFVGQAGQLLTKILEAINLSREDVFICNVLKHRPPGNRNPLPEEVHACSPFLLRQLELLRPEVILALGTYAAQTLLQTKQSIGALRGQVHRYYGIPLIVTYHPAALLRNPGWKRPCWEDVQLARRVLDSARAHRAA